MLTASTPNKKQVETMISLSNELIAGNGELFSTVIALGELLAPAGFDTQAFEELRALYEAANAILNRQVAELKTVRTREAFRALAQQRIDEIRSLRPSIPGGNTDTPAKEAC